MGDLPHSSTAGSGELPVAYRTAIPPVAFAGVVAVTILLSLVAFFAFVWSVSPDRAIFTWHYVLERLFTLTGWQPVTYFELLGAVLIGEALLLGWSRSSIRLILRGSRSARTDLVVAGLHAVGWSALLMTAFTGGALWLLQDFTVPFQKWRLAEWITPTWVQVLVVFLFIDFLDYWTHRIMHEIAFLWEAHKYHHAATEFTILTGNRIHALEEAFRSIVTLIPMAAIGTPASMYFGVRYTINIIDMIQHSMLAWDYGWFGRWVAYSPIGHRIHHSPLEEHWDTNYGNILVIWDRLFGTWYGGAAVNETVDVSDNPYNRRSVAVEYMLCGGWFGQSFVRSLRTWTWRTEYQRMLRSRRRKAPADGAAA
jgi:sterol desaturase/sphingolipid hydroxylase (fatty acid hydroxylase superfamily)